MMYGGDETRSFCYIDDAVEAIQAVMESKMTDGGTYHIGTREETNMRELAEGLFAIAKWHPSEFEEKKSPAGSVKRRLPDVSKIKRDTGWEAKVGLTDGLRRTYAWYIHNPAPEKLSYPKRRSDDV